MSIEFGKRLHDAGGYYAKALTVPQNTSVATDALKTGKGGQLGQLEVAVYAAEDVSLADTKKLTIVLQDSDTSDSGFTDLLTTSVTASGATTISAGDLIARVPIPTNADVYTRMNVTTDDAAATGKVMAVLEGQFSR